MSALIENLLVQWALLMGSPDAISVVAPWVAPALACCGAVLCFAGVKAFRPTFCVVVFFGLTALLMVLLSPVLPWYGVVSTVAILGIFAAFLALFMKRVSLACLSALGAGALAYTIAPSLLWAIVAGVVGLLLSCLRPKETFAAVTALVGSSLAAGCIATVSARVSPQAAEAISSGTLGGAVLWLALAAAGVGVQLLIARKGLDPVFTQTIDLSKLRPRQTAPSGLAPSATRPAAPEAKANQHDVAESVLHTRGIAPEEAAGTVVADGMSAAGASTATGIAPVASAAAAAGLGAAAIAGVAAVGSGAVSARSAEPSPAAPIEPEAPEEPACKESAAPARPITEYIQKPKPYAPTFRKEVKYRIEEQDFLRLMNRLDAYLAFDPFSGSEGYPVRSLYFDSLDDRDLYDKLDGTLEHKKIRMRTYDPLGDSFNLEYKCRWDGDGIKRKLKLNREQAMRLVRNDYRVLREFEPDPLVAELFDRMVRGRYIPKVIVEYHRTAWEYPASNIRITWDRGIRASYFPESFFEERPLYIPILPQNQGVLEIKYDYVFPSILKDALRSIDQLPVANSKYALGRRYL